MQFLSGLTKGQVVTLDWLDSASLSGWQYEEGTLDIGIIKSAGLVVESNERQLVITSALNDETSFISPLAIPWVAIISLKVIPNEALL